ncbi:MAG: type IV pilus assembly protein PilM [Candidatus Brocadiia bacterium]
MAKGVWGIDVSKSSIKAVRLQPDKEGNIELTNIEIIEYTPSESRDEASLDQEIRIAVNTLVSRNKFKKDIVAVSLPGHAIFNRFVKIPPVNRDRIDSVIKYEAQQHIPFPIEEVIWVYQVIENNYRPDQEIDVVFFAIKKEVVDQFLALMSVSNLSVDIVQFAPVALYNFAMHQMPLVFSKEGMVIIDMGANNSDLVLVEGNRFWIRNLPIVGNTITKSIQDKLEVSYADAERLKTTTTAGQTQEAAKIFGAIQSVLKDLASEIHRSIGFYKSLVSGRTVNFKNLVLAGNATKMIYFEEFLSQRLQLAVSKLSTLNHIDVSEKVDKVILDKNLPSLGVAFGLSLQALGLTPSRINLMPPELIRVKTISRKKIFVSVIMVVLIMISVLLYLSAKTAIEQLGEIDLEMQEIIMGAERTNKTFLELQKIQEKEKYLETISSIGTGRDTYIKVFNAMNNIESLVKNILAPAKGYIEKGNDDDFKVVGLNEKNRIWILNIKMEMVPDVLNFSAICAVVARQKSNDDFDPVASQDFIKEKMLKQLAQEFGVTEPKLSLMDTKPVPKLLTKDEQSMMGAEGTEEENELKPKYYRFLIQLAIPIKIK